jgi:uncharacterized protein DUF6339
MSTELRRFSRMLGPDDLPDVLTHPTMFETESLGISVDLGPARAVADKLLADLSPGAPRVTLASWDEAMVEPLHASFAGVPRRLLSDMRLWHWLCTGTFREFVVARWCSERATEAYDDLTAAERGRFLGKASLNGVSRNALARLFWCGEALWDKNSGYNLARAALRKQDFFQAVFERKFGLHRPAARACVNNLADATEMVWRNSLKGLNFCLSTMVVEAMDESAITDLLAEFAA